MHVIWLFLLMHARAEVTPFCMKGPGGAAPEYARVAIYKTGKVEGFRSTDMTMEMEDGIQQRYSELPPSEWRQLERLRMSHSGTLSKRGLRVLFEALRKATGRKQLLFVDLEETPRALLDEDAVAYLTCRKGHALHMGLSEARAQDKRGRDAREKASSSFGSAFLEHLQMAGGSRLAYVDGKDVPALHHYASVALTSEAVAREGAAYEYYHIPIHMERGISKRKLQLVLSLLNLHGGPKKPSWVHVQARKPQAAAIFTAIADLFMEEADGPAEEERAQTLHSVLDRVRMFTGEELEVTHTEKPSWRKAKEENMEIFKELHRTNRSVRGFALEESEEREGP